MGEAGEGRNITHQQKKLNETAAASPAVSTSRFREEGGQGAVLPPAGRQRRRWSISGAAARRWAASLPGATEPTVQLQAAEVGTSSRSSRKAAKVATVSTTMAFVRLWAGC